MIMGIAKYVFLYSVGCGMHGVGGGGFFKDKHKHVGKLQWAFCYFEGGNMWKKPIFLQLWPLENKMFV